MPAAVIFAAFTKYVHEMSSAKSGTNSI